MAIVALLFSIVGVFTEFDDSALKTANANLSDELGHLKSVVTDLETTVKFMQLPMTIDAWLADAKNLNLTSGMHSFM